MDRIILSGIELFAFGGVTEEEKRVGQRYRVDVTLEVDVRAAGLSDALEDTVHYGDVHAAVIETARLRPFNLLESVAERIAERLLQQFPAERVTVRFEKLLPPIDGVVAAAAVEITRRRAQQALSE